MKPLVLMHKLEYRCQCFNCLIILVFDRHLLFRYCIIPFKVLLQLQLSQVRIVHLPAHLPEVSKDLQLVLLFLPWKECAILVVVVEARINWGRFWISSTELSFRRIMALFTRFKQSCVFSRRLDIWLEDYWMVWWIWIRWSNYIVKILIFVLKFVF
jgi:hypothetical protein